MYFEKVRTGQKQSNVSVNGGITATFSIPLDRTAIKECRKAMKKQNELYDYRNELIKEMNGLYEDMYEAQKTYERTKNELDYKPIEIYKNKIDALSIKEEIS